MQGYPLLSPPTCSICEFYDDRVGIQGRGGGGDELAATYRSVPFSPGVRWPYSVVDKIEVLSVSSGVR